ncbi:V-type proton ATPase subunit E [Methanobacterium paludis]|uniref:A-type ATP synthase subunit E n=1 Tax=Methanobacterium paludis (strain DSM 25820 / JCM 18151 / SWAN1) TaxID=868131 RepID=F6D6U0_METPW|nr:V-type proton ATPase subunit E [Methanobacterium paludis]AEG18978.1 V-type proton ATPase subunit E [Methanobacterium paludis]
MSSGAEKIVSNIISDAQSKADATIQKAQEETTAILEEGKNKAQMESEKILENAEKQANMKYQQLISEAKMNSKRMELEAREEIIEESFRKAREELKKIASTSTEEYIKSLKNMVKEASVEIGGGELVVLLKEEDVANIKKEIKSIENDVTDKTGQKTTIEIGENIKAIGGAIVKTKNGEIEVNNTIDARMLRFKKALRSEVAKVLFK